MRRIDLVVALLCAIVPLVAMARRARVAYPIVLVLGGLVLGFVPHLPPIELPPQIVLLVFLPPLLYWEALKAPVGLMRADAGTIRTLVIGLVLATATAVAVVAHAMIPHMPWAAAFVLGAIVAPTDAVAFAPVASRLGVPHRITALVEAEGLLNDASALVFYAAAVAAVVSGTFTLRAALFGFVVSCVAAVAVGLVVGALVRFAWTKIRDANLQMVVSILAPYVAYLPAHDLGFSGVLAVVTLGLYLNRHGTAALTPQTRRQNEAFWKTGAFVMNALIFLVVGLELHPVLARLSVYSRLHLVVMALAVSVTVVVMRLVWLFGNLYVVHLRHRSTARGDVNWKYRLVASWAGFRGGVSLAAALAIPLTIASGADFPRRQLTIFLTFGVILFTLVGQGVTLPYLIRALRLPKDTFEATEERDALIHASDIAIERLRALEVTQRAAPEAAALLERHYENRKRWLQSQRRDERPAPFAIPGYEPLARDLLRVQRTELLLLRRSGRIETSTLLEIEAIFDYEELELDRLAALGPDAAV